MAPLRPPFLLVVPAHFCLNRSGPPPQYLLMTAHSPQTWPGSTYSNADHTWFCTWQLCSRQLGSVRRRPNTFYQPSALPTLTVLVLLDLPIKVVTVMWWRQCRKTMEPGINSGTGSQLRQENGRAIHPQNLGLWVAESASSLSHSHTVLTEFLSHTTQSSRLVVGLPIARTPPPQPPQPQVEMVSLLP